jgi:altronate hydrolase
MQLIARTRTGDSAVIRLNPLDNVLIARQALPEGLSLEAEAIIVRQPIPLEERQPTGHTAPGRWQAQHSGLELITEQ